MIYLLSSSYHNEVDNLPMIEFLPIADNIDLSHADILLFTSKNAVVITNKINPAWKKLASIAIGSQTAKAIEELGGMTIEIDESFYVSNLAKMIAEKFANKNILYLRPQKIASDDISSLKDLGINITEKIIYETKCKIYDIKDRPPLGSIIIATSPSTIKCFMKNFGSLDRYKIIAIGTTTAASLPKGIDFKIPPKPLISECIKLAKEMLDMQNKPISNRK
ncbi:MAG: uroporphyrinogen-III synthase [Sulfurovaceae bacterium]|nr:uroporphyrinogen-III synthase [Sulfurovaceae bacterium]